MRAKTFMSEARLSVHDRIGEERGRSLLDSRDVTTRAREQAGGESIHKGQISRSANGREHERRPHTIAGKS